MFYRKSSEQVAVEGVFSLFGFMIKLFWNLLLYSPFVIAGFFVATLIQKLLGFQNGFIFFISLGFGAYLLFLFVAFFENIAENLKSTGNILWLLPKSINLIIICGVPCKIGAGFGLSMCVNLPKASEFEIYVVGIISGLIFSAIAYSAVINKIHNSVE